MIHGDSLCQTKFVTCGDGACTVGKFAGQYQSKYQALIGKNTTTLVFDDVSVTNCLVTGASGFIGSHLVELLVSRGDQVTCLVRPNSDCSRLEKYPVRFVRGDITDEQSLPKAVSGNQVVYHLAGLTRSLSRQGLKRVNQVGTRNLAAACASAGQTPTLVVVSSLAAGGPSVGEQPRTEAEPPRPVSEYGKSKLAGELEAKQFAAEIPITVLRPPIVFGEGDKDVFEMIRGIAKWRVHLVPGLVDRRFSFIHAQDLATAMVLAGESGERISAQPNDAKGTYYTASDESLTYASFGRLIGEVLDKKTYVVRCPDAAIWLISAFADGISRIRRHPSLLNLDKAREATAPGWTCTSDAFKADTGFAIKHPLHDRIVQTVDWYRTHGWLR